MNVNGIGTAGYPAWYGTRKAESSTEGNFGANVKEASNAKNVVNNTTNIVIHGFMGEKTEAGDTVVGAWGNAVTGTSTTVYKPQNFDENNPVYYMKIWDKDGNVTERTVNLNEIDPKNCNSFDMYAYCCYANDSGKSSSAMTNFMGSHAHYAMYEVVTKYLPRLANSQVVLDSGALVGELSDGLNRELGKAYS